MKSITMHLKAPSPKKTARAGSLAEERLVSYREESLRRLRMIASCLFLLSELLGSEGCRQHSVYKLVMQFLEEESKQIAQNLKDLPAEKENKSVDQGKDGSH